MKPKIVIIGAGGHGKVVCDAIQSKNEYELVGFIDSVSPVGSTVIDQYKVISSQDEMSSVRSIADFFIVAIGNNTVRENLYTSAKQLFKPAKIIHSSAVIAKNAAIGEGSVVLANATINAGCIIGQNSIINIGVLIDHDCNIGNHLHLSVGTIVGSHTIVADNFTSALGEKYNTRSKIG